MECIKQNTNNGRLSSYSFRSNANCKLCDENKGMPESLPFFHRHQHPEIEFSQRKMLKMLRVPHRWKGKRKKAAEELPFMPVLPKPIWNTPGFTFPPFSLKSLDTVLPPDSNTHISKHVFIWQSSSRLSKQKYMLTSRSKIMPKQRAYLKNPRVCLAFCLLAFPNLGLNQWVV